MGIGTLLALFALAQGKVTFEVPKPTDVEVAIVDAQGNVVRHLAAGVLGGKNPPPEPLKPGLSQSLEWDGNDDLGRPARGGPFKARVRTGLGVSFGRIVADSPYNFSETMGRGLAVDANGDLYVLGLKTRDAVLYFLRVYDRKGNYLREILPCPPTLDPAARKPYGVVTLPGGEVLPQNYFSLWPVFYPFADYTRARAVKLLGLHPADGSVVLLAENQSALYRIRKTDGGAASERFEEPLWKKGEEPKGRMGLVMGAYAPDGKTLYLTGFAGIPPKGERLDAKWPDGRVYQVEIDKGGARPFFDIALPDNVPPPVQAWHYSGNECTLHGLALDASGRVHVCDAVGGKVFVYTPDGKLVETVEAPGAYMSASDPKTGALYVLTRRSGGYQIWKKSLLKISGGKIVDRLDFPEKGGGPDPFMAADFSASPVQIWVSGCPRVESLIRIEDAGKLGIAEDLAERGKVASGFAARMAVDPEADLVYINNGWSENLRYNGLTGEYAGEFDGAGRPKPIAGSELCIAPDGTIYRSGSNYSGKMSRLKRELSPAPLADGKPEFGYYYGRMGGGYFGNHGCSVDASGRLLICCMFNWCQYAVIEIGPDGKAVGHPRLKDVPWGDAENYKKAGIDSALIGWLPTRCGGLKAGPKGYVYLGVQVLPREFKFSEGLDQIHGYAQMTGSVLKFKPTGGACYPDDRKGEWSNGPVTMKIPEKFEEGLPMGGLRTQHGVSLKQTYFEGAVRAYPGLAPFSGFDRSDGCVCQSPRFDVDEYGRVYLPNALTCSVTVVDDSGNEIVRFGGYGNRDCEGPKSRVVRPEIPLAYPVAVGVSAKRLYVADSANRRVVRVDPVYASERLVDLK